MLDIIMEDEHILVVRKKAGIESQSGKSFAMDLASEIKTYLTRKSKEKTPAYVGVIHRLDRQVSGVMVYAKTKRAAAHLSKQVQDGTMKKYYYALLCGTPIEKSGTLVDYLLTDKRNNVTTVVDKHTQGAKYAELFYEVCPMNDWSEVDVLAKKYPEEIKDTTLVKVHLITGRQHQIRVQFSSRNLSLFGDKKYNKHYNQGFNEKRVEAIGLCACQLSFVHPITNKEMTFYYEKNTNKKSLS